MTQVEHVEKDVVRDGNGRILRVEEHKWLEAGASYTDHAKALNAVRAENAALHATVKVLNDKINALVAGHQTQLAQLNEAWEEGQGESNAVLITQLAERDAQVIAQRDEHWFAAFREASVMFEEFASWVEGISIRTDSNGVALVQRAKEVAA